MLRHQCKIIGVGVQCRNAGAHTRGPFQQVIIVHANVCDAFSSENAHHAVGEGCLPRSTIATDCHYKRLTLTRDALHWLLLGTFPVYSTDNLRRVNMYHVKIQSQKESRSFRLYTGGIYTSIAEKSITKPYLTRCRQGDLKVLFSHGSPVGARVVE